MTPKDPEFFRERQSVLDDLDDVLAAASSDFGGEEGAMPEHLRCKLSKDFGDDTVRMTFANWRAQQVTKITKIERLSSKNTFWGQSIVEGETRPVKYVLTIFQILDEGFEVIGEDGAGYLADWITIEVFEDGSASLSYRVELDDLEDEADELMDDRDEEDDSDDEAAVSVLVFKSSNSQAEHEVIMSHIRNALDIEEWLSDFREYRDLSFNAALIDILGPDA